MKFHNGGMGECIILKESNNTDYKLIYSVNGQQFIIIHDLNMETGNWEGGSYYGNNLDDALEDYNDKVKKYGMEDLER